jgi:ribose transport system substrate-binding protein
MRGSPRRLVLVAVLGAAALLAVAVAGSAVAAKAGRAGTAQPVKIGFINLSDQIPFAVSVRRGVQAAAKRRGVQLVVCDSRLSVERAINCARQFKSQGVQGIANFQADQAAAPRVCAAGPKVPVVAVDIPQKPCQRVFFGADNFEAGRIAGLALGQFAKQRWNCEVDALLSINSPANKLVIVRENGMRRGVQSHCPGVRFIRVAPTAYTTDATIQPFTDTLTRLPGQSHLLVHGINDDVAIGAVKAAQAANRLGDIYVAAQGADPTAWPYLCGNTPFKNWVADTGYFPERYGNYIVPILTKLINGQKQPRTVYLKHEAVTPRNIKKLYKNACK